VSPTTAQVAVAIAVYATLVVTVGLAARSRAAHVSPDEYFLAGRRLGTLVLFMAVFGTNATAFVLVGIPGKAYHDGIGTFGVNAPIVALGIPLTFALIGAPARRMGARLGALTPAELYGERLGSRAVAVLMFAAYTVYTLPYMVTTVKGTAVTLSGVTGAAWPEAATCVGVVLVALLYTAVGGMRATAWTNVAQGLLFVAFMVGAFVVVSASMGGLPEAMTSVAAHDPDLLVVDRVDGPVLFRTPRWVGWGLVISLTVIGFPHMLVRLMAARDEASLKTICRLYPIALVLLWVPAVMIGVWGAVEFPGLRGRASDAILSLMAAAHLPSWMAAVAPVAVLAAAMSTLDAMILTLSSMLVRDVVHPLVPRLDDVRAGRLFALLLAALVVVLSLAWGESVFAIASFAFEGYVTLTPLLLLGVRWRRLNATGAVASILAGNAVLLAGRAEWFDTRGQLPVVWAFGAAFAAAWIGSLASAPPEAERTARAFGDAGVTARGPRPDEAAARARAASRGPGGGQAR